MSRHDLAIDTSTPAVVLKLDPNVMHHGGLGVIRSLGRLGVPVHAVYEDSLAPAAHSRYLHGRWLWRPGSEAPGRLLDGLRRLAERIGRPAVLFPTDDAGAIFLAEHGDELRRWFRFPAPPAALPRQLAGKYSLYQLCRELDVACPQAAQVGVWAEAGTFAERVGFPLVAKLVAPWRSGGAVRSTTIIRTPDELARLRPADAGEVMLQEYIPGGRGHDWFFHGYCDANSTCRPACTGVKERSYPAHAGLTSLGRCAENSALRREATRLLERLSFQGIVDLDFRWDARDGRYRLLDFNPRLGAQFRLFRDTTGVDVALAAYLDLTGQGVEHGEPVSGRRFLVENYDPIAALSYWRRRELGARSWFASLREVDETAWFARDDLAPFGLMCLRMGWRAITRCTGRQGNGHRAGGRTRSVPEQPQYRPGRAVRTAHNMRRTASHRLAGEDRA
jgi:D-aspartate ligase